MNTRWKCESPLRAPLKLTDATATQPRRRKLLLMKATKPQSV
jgi:hypothetical protein